MEAAFWKESTMTFFPKPAILKLWNGVCVCVCVVVCVCCIADHYVIIKLAIYKVCFCLFLSFGCSASEAAEINGLNAEIIGVCTNWVSWERNKWSE